MWFEVQDQGMRWKSLCHRCGLGFTAWVIIAASLCMGCVPKGTKNPDAKRDFLAEFEGLETTFRGQCTLSKGLLSLAKSKVDELLYVSADFRARRVRWRRFRRALNSCWKGALGNPTDSGEIDVSGLAPYYDEDALSDNEALLAVATRVIDSYGECDPLNADEMSGFDGRGVADESRAWARDRMVIMNEIRILVRGELARRTQSIEAMVGTLRTESAALSEKVTQVSKTVDGDYSATPAEKEKLRNQSVTIRSRLGVLNDLVLRCEKEVGTSTTDLSTFDQTIEATIKQIGRRN